MKEDRKQGEQVANSRHPAGRAVEGKLGAAERAKDSAETKSLLGRKKKPDRAQSLLAMQLFPRREYTGHLRSSSGNTASRQAGRKLQ